MEKKRVVTYCRVRKNTNQGLLKSNAEKYVASHPDWQSEAIYIDEGSEQTEFQRLITDAEQDLFDLVVTRTVSRFGRNLADCYYAIDKLRSLSSPVGVYFQTEQIYTLDQNTDTVFSFLSVMAEEESRRKSENDYIPITDQTYIRFRDMINQRKAEGSKTHRCKKRRE